MAAAGRQKHSPWRSSFRLRRWHSVIVVFIILCWAQVLFLSSGSAPYDDVFLAARSPFSHKRDTKSTGHRRIGRKASFKRATVAELDGYSIKPIVYVYPQFHSFPENDQFFGENYTDWDLVSKTIINSHGLKTFRPGKEVGFYDLLDVTTRERWTNMISESLIYGVAYHHYWFGKPVMHGVLMTMLEDGHPDVPFMLSWSNEPWTTRRDGKDVTLLEQTYGGVEDWKRHFEWLTPYFRHVNYIRSRGKVQFIVKNPAHMGATAKLMFEAWRLWAAEDPEIGGLDIIESVTTTSGGSSTGGSRSSEGSGSGSDSDSSAGPGLWTDAVNEYSTVNTDNKLDYASWAKPARPHRVFHRGAMVSWDDTPRHLRDRGAMDVPFAHPRLWKAALVQLCHRIKSDPNPRGEENFLFINALNDWANGNVLEPSEEWQHQFLETFHDALQYADENFEWAPWLVAQNLRLSKQVANPEAAVDVCVIIREFRTVSPWRDTFTLEHTLESLRDMKNPRWRAVVARVLPEVDARSVEDAVAAAHDPRVTAIEPPSQLLRRSGESRHGAEITDWAIRNMNVLSPGCARARYLLITNSTNMYEDDTLDAADKDVADVIGLNFESADTMAAYEATKRGKLFYDDRCGRFDHEPALHCAAMKPNGGVLDIGAALISMTRWRRDGLVLAEAASTSELGEAGILRRLARHSNKPWSWALPAVSTSDSCNLIRANTRTACLRSGRTWVDVPDVEGFRPGCYTVAELGRAHPGKLVPATWDYPRFRLNPYCLRLSKTLSKELEKKWRPYEWKNGQKTVGKTDWKMDPEKDEKDWKKEWESGSQSDKSKDWREDAAKDKTKADSEDWGKNWGTKSNKDQGDDWGKGWKADTKSDEADDWRGDWKTDKTNGKASDKTKDDTSDWEKVWEPDSKQDSWKDWKTDGKKDDTKNDKQSDWGKGWGTDSDGKLKDQSKDEKSSWNKGKEADDSSKDDSWRDPSKKAQLKEDDFKDGFKHDFKDDFQKDGFKDGSKNGFSNDFKDGFKDDSKDGFNNNFKDGFKNDGFKKEDSKDGFKNDFKDGFKDDFKKDGFKNGDSKDSFKKEDDSKDGFKNEFKKDTFKDGGLKGSFQDDFKKDSFNDGFKDDFKKNDAKDDFRKADFKADFRSGFQPNNLKKDDFKKDDFKKDDFKKDDFKKDDFKKDDFKKDDFKKDSFQTDNLKKDDAKKEGFKDDANKKDSFQKDSFNTGKILDDKLQKEKILDSKLQKDSLGKDASKSDQSHFWKLDDKKVDDKKVDDKKVDDKKTDGKKEDKKVDDEAWRLGMR